MQTALMDMEFEKLRDMLPNVTLNTTAAREHVGEIERKIRVVKERARSTIDNEDKYEMVAETKILVPFPDIAAEAPGILTEQEEIMGVNEVIQSERQPSGK